MDRTPYIQIWPSTDVYEDHFLAGMGIPRRSFAQEYANDFLFSYAEQFVRQGARVEIVIPTLDVIHQELESSLLDGVTIRWVSVHRTSRILRFRRGRRLRWLISAAITRAALGQAPVPDVYYVQEYASGRFYTVARSIRKVSGVVVVGAHHGRPSSQFAARRVARVVGPPVIFTCLTKAESAALTNDLLQARCSAPSILVVPNTARVIEDEPGTQQRRGSVVIARLFDRQKNISALLHALTRIEAHLWAPLVVFGDGPDRTALEALATELSLNTAIEWRGFVEDRALIAEAMLQSRFMFMPSRYEGMPLAVLEAQGAGLVLAVSDLPAFRESVHSRNAFVDPESQTDIIRGLSDVLTMPDADLNDVSAANRELVRTEFNAETVFAELFGAIVRTQDSSRVKSGRRK